MRGSLKTPYLLLFILLVSCFVTYFSIPFKSSWIKGFALEMATDISGSYNLLARQEIRNLFKEYVNLVSELFEQYNKRVPEEKQLKISEDLWADDVPPKIGSGRP